MKYVSGNHSFPNFKFSNFLNKFSFESWQWTFKMKLNTLANRLSTLANWTLAKPLVSETTDIPGSQPGFFFI